MAEHGAASAEAVGAEWFGVIRATRMLLTISPAEYLHRQLETTSIRADGDHAKPVLAIPYKLP